MAYSRRTLGSSIRLDVGFLTSSQGSPIFGFLRDMDAIEKYLSRLDTSTVTGNTVHFYKMISQQLNILYATLISIQLLTKTFLDPSIAHFKKSVFVSMSKEHLGGAQALLKEEDVESESTDINKYTSKKNLEGEEQMKTANHYYSARLARYGIHVQRLSRLAARTTRAMRDGFNDAVQGFTPKGDNDEDKMKGMEETENDTTRTKEEGAEEGGETKHSLLVFDEDLDFDKVKEIHEEVLSQLRNIKSQYDTPEAISRALIDTTTEMMAPQSKKESFSSPPLDSSLLVNNSHVIERLTGEPGKWAVCKDIEKAGIPLIPFALGDQETADCVSAWLLESFTRQKHTRVGYAADCHNSSSEGALEVVKKGKQNVSFLFMDSNNSLEIVDVTHPSPLLTPGFEGDAFTSSFIEEKVAESAIEEISQVKEREQSPLETSCIKVEKTFPTSSSFSQESDKAGTAETPFSLEIPPVTPKKEQNETKLQEQPSSSLPLSAEGKKRKSVEFLTIDFVRKIVRDRSNIKLSFKEIEELLAKYGIPFMDVDSTDFDIFAEVEKLCVEEKQTVVKEIHAMMNEGKGASFLSHFSISHPAISLESSTEGKNKACVLERKPANTFLFIVLNIMFRYTFVKQFNIEKIIRYFTTIQSLYREDTPYHNSLHAADVCQATHIYLCSNNVYTNFSDVELFALIFSAADHDVGHLGVNNLFLIKTNHPVAILYSGRSPMESTHVCIALHVLSFPECNFLPTDPTIWSPEKDKEFKNLVTDIIIGTDMNFHASIVASVVDILEDGVIEDDEIALLLKAIVHAADLSNPMKPLHLYLNWMRRVNEEFWLQGDSEKARGIPISVMCDRNNSKLAASQVGFISFVIKPFITAFSVMLPPQWIARLNYNLQYMKSQAALIDSKIRSASCVTPNEKSDNISTRDRSNQGESNTYSVPRNMEIGTGDKQYKTLEISDILFSKTERGGGDAEPVVQEALQYLVPVQKEWKDTFTSNLVYPVDHCDPDMLRKLQRSLLIKDQPSRGLGSCLPFKLSLSETNNYDGLFWSKSADAGCISPVQDIISSIFRIDVRILERGLEFLSGVDVATLTELVGDYNVDVTSSAFSTPRQIDTFSPQNKLVCPVSANIAHQQALHHCYTMADSANRNVVSERNPAKAGSCRKVEENVGEGGDFVYNALMMRYKRICRMYKDMPRYSPPHDNTLRPTGYLRHAYNPK